MFISDISIKRSVLTVMVTASLFVFGIVSYVRLGVDLFPDVDFPIVTVTTVLVGADPETIELEVTDRVEEAVNTIDGIKTMRSESTEGVSMVFIEFELYKDINVAAQDVRDKVGTITRDLPTGVETPVIEKMDLDAAPILAVALSGDMGIRELTHLADKYVKERLQQVTGVGSVKLVGGRDREIRVWLDPDKLDAYRLSVQDVIRALRTENVEIPGGRIEAGEKEFVVKTKGEVEKVSDFAEIIVAHREGAPIKVRHVGTVEDGLEDERTLSRLNGERAVSLLIRRQSGTNVVKVADAVKKEIEKMRPSLPDGVNMILASDMSRFVKDSINDVQSSLILGAILAILTILVFLRNIRSTFVTMMAIPTAIIGTFTLIYALGFTLNTMTMMALALSVGIVVDDAIVVIENIYRHMEEGKSPREAAEFGTREIGFAVIAVSLSLLAVFVPVAFMQGMVGQFFYEFGLTMAFAIAISLFVSLTLTPMLSSRLLSVPSSHGWLFAGFERLYAALEQAYKNVLAFALNHRWLVVTTAIIIFVLSMGITNFVGKEFIPAEDRAEFNLRVEAPLGSSIENTSGILGNLEKISWTCEGVKDLFTTVGGGAQEKVNEGNILVKLVDRSQRSRHQEDVMAQLREKLLNFHEAKTSVEVVEDIGGGGMRAAPIQFNVRGPDLAKLEDFSGKIMDHMHTLPGLVDIDSTYETGKPEARVHIDRDRAADLGVSIMSVAETVGALVGGQDVTTYKELGDQYDVRVRLEEDFRRKPQDILRLKVPSLNGNLIDFANLVKVDQGTGPSQIDRQSRQRQITILANLERGTPLGTAATQIEQYAGSLDIPPEYKYDFTGFADIMRESFANIIFSLVLAIIIVYMVLASQFDSYIHPFTIMLSLPLSVVGALGGLFLARMSLNIMSMIGMIVLAGVVTKNAVLLVDYTNTLRERGMERRAAILQAGPTRLRPILMTTLSTVFGMLPIALGLGSGAEMRAPMAVCIIGGLMASTMLTLLVIPVVYTILDDVSAGVIGRVFRRRATV